MSDPSREDVLDKLDALMKRHQPPAEVEIPVLTDVVAPPQIDLDSIPLLTEEVGLAAPPEPSPTETPGEATPLPELEPLEFVTAFEAEPSTALETVEPMPAPESVPELPILEEVPASISIAPVQVTDEPAVLEFEVPPEARYVSLSPSTEETPTTLPPAPEPALAPAAAVTTPEIHALSEETIQLIADTIKGDVARILDIQLQQALAQQLQNSLHVALDRALSSMLDQFVIHIEEVVKVSIASELKKQLDELPRPEQH